MGSSVGDSGRGGDGGETTVGAFFGATGLGFATIRSSSSSVTEKLAHNKIAVGIVPTKTVQGDDDIDIAADVGGQTGFWVRCQRHFHIRLF